MILSGPGSARCPQPAGKAERAGPAFRFGLAASRSRDLIGQYLCYKWRLLTDFVRRFLLHKVRSLYGDRLLIRPRPAEFPLRTNQECRWVGVNEQLGYRTLGEPAGVRIDDLSQLNWPPMHKSCSRGEPSRFVLPTCAIGKIVQLAMGQR
jgi:hypothetical protein